MPKRIPHTDFEVLTGKNTAEEYLEMQKRLGKFDLIYTTFSMHHWKNPVNSICILYTALNDDGLLFIYDFERNWLAYLPLERGIRESIRASYTPKEIESMMEELNLENYQITKRFPYLSLFVKK